MSGSRRSTKNVPGTPQSERSPPPGFLGNREAAQRPICGRTATLGASEGDYNPGNRPMTTRTRYNTLGNEWSKEVR